MITLSCQHEVDSQSEGIEVAIAEIDQEGKNVINNMVICNLCLEAYERTGIILKTEQEKQDYLNGK